MSELVGYNVSPPVISWLLSFLTGRSQDCKVNGHLSMSNPCAINQGIVQGSGIGLQLYVAMKISGGARVYGAGGKGSYSAPPTDL